MTQPGPNQFRDTNGLMTALRPLKGPTGQAYLYTLGFCSDLLMEKANQAVKIRIPGQGDATQLPYLAQDRAMVQGPAETNDAFADRLAGAFPTWKTAGSGQAVLGQLLAYIQGLQPGVPAGYPLMAIVGDAPGTTKWMLFYQGAPVGSEPVLVNQSANWNWDGIGQTWRAWLIFYMAPVAVGLQGINGSITGSAGGSIPGGQTNSSGHFVPPTHGTPVNSPWLTVNGLSGLSSANTGQWLQLSDCVTAGNNGLWPITSVTSSSVCVIANPNGSSPDTGSRPGVTWSVVSYPWFGPSMPLGTLGRVWGQGEQTLPPIDTGALHRGVWGPTPNPLQTAIPTGSWGLTCSSLVLQSIRQILVRWKSAGTYYPNVIVTFGGGAGGPGNSYSPYDSGTGLPDGSFGQLGTVNGDGVWAPTRLVSSYYDCYCQGSGVANACSLENIT